MRYQFNEDLGIGLAEAPAHPQRLQDAGAAGRRIRPGRRRWGLRICPGCSCKHPPEHWPRTTAPDVWFCYRTNPAISSWNAPEVGERLAEFPFIVAFAYTYDETNHIADILLPEATDLESMQLIRIGSTKFTEQFWKHEGWAMRQPAVEPVGDAMDMTDISHRTCAAIGRAEGIQCGDQSRRRGHGRSRAAATNSTIRSTHRTGAPASRTSGTRICKAASHELSDGEEVHDLAWFKENGFMLRPFPQLGLVSLSGAWCARACASNCPTRSASCGTGEQLAHRLHGSRHRLVGQAAHRIRVRCRGYERYAGYLERLRARAGRDPADYPLWAMTARSMQYSWGANVGLPIINEVANNIAGHRGVIINRSIAKKMGIAEGDEVVIESRFRHYRGQSGAARGHPAGHRADDRPVRSLEDARMQRT